jgi:hypothetical protein
MALESIALVRNMSDEGANLEVESQIGIPNSFDLIIDSEHSNHQCQSSGERRAGSGLHLIEGNENPAGGEIAEHLLSQAATGERDFDRLKASAFNKLATSAVRVSGSEGPFGRRPNVGSSKASNAAFGNVGRNRN